jgi:hypothetical protein
MGLDAYAMVELKDGVDDFKLPDSNGLDVDIWEERDESGLIILDLNQRYFGECYTRKEPQQFLVMGFLFNLLLSEKVSRVWYTPFPGQWDLDKYNDSLVTITEILKNLLHYMEAKGVDALIDKTEEEK